MADTYLGSVEMYSKGEKCLDLIYVLVAGQIWTAYGLVMEDERKESRMTCSLGLEQLNGYGAIN